MKEPQYQDPMVKISRPEEPQDLDELSTTLWQAYRKFANKNIEKIAEALYAHGPLSFAELGSETGQPTNILNHNLIEMRHTDLVKLNEEKYYLTKYGALLLESSNQIKDTIKKFNKNEMLTSFYGSKRD